MRTATALTMVPVHPGRDDDQHQPGVGQVPLPFPGMRPVLPVPVHRASPHDPRAVAQLRGPAAKFLQALTEVLTGERPTRQLGPWLAPDVYAELSRRVRPRTPRATPSAVPPGLGPRRGARIVSVHLALVGDHAAEVAGRMVQDGRSRAIAARLELRTSARGRRTWLCTALEGA